MSGNCPGTATFRQVLHSEGSENLADQLVSYQKPPATDLGTRPAGCEDEYGELLHLRPKGLELRLFLQ
jgi:hypothetical protein